MFDVSCWNWTGPKVDPKTNKLFFLDTAAFGRAAFSRKCIADQLNFGTDEYGDYIEFIAASGLKDSGTTENTDYPRSELRQTLPTGEVKQANWTAPKAPQSMQAKLRVLSLGKSLKAILGQIHGDPGEHPPLKIQITGDTVYAQLRRQLDGVEDKPALGKIKLGVPFTYRVEVFDDFSANIYFNEQLIIERYQFDAKSYAKDTWYWKAGMYSQEKAKGGSGIGCVRFYEIEVKAHAARSLADLSQEVDTALRQFQAGKVTDKDALATIQTLKVEADTDFQKGAERSDLYGQITAARAIIRA